MLCEKALCTLLSQGRTSFPPEAEAVRPCYRRNSSRHPALRSRAWLPASSSECSRHQDEKGLLARVGPRPYRPAMITDMRAGAARVPAQEKSRPAVMMHGFGRSWRRYRNLQHPHKGILKNNLVTLRCCNNRVISIREWLLVLGASGMLLNSDRSCDK